MKYQLTFQCRYPVSLPVQYNKILQAVLLKWMGDEEYSTFLHDEGYQHNKRIFKPYTFSNLMGEYQYNPTNHRITFQNEIRLYLSFYTEESHPLILKNVAARKPIELSGQNLEFIDCAIVHETYTDCLVKTVSPITIHSTLETKDGKKKTYYYSPMESEFSSMIRDNLLRKYMALYERKPKDDSFWIQVKNSRQLRPANMYYNKFVIRGWNGLFYLKGSEELIRLALLGGVGARNGIGMGCLLQQEWRE